MDHLAQISTNVLIATGIISLFALSFSLAYSVTRFFDFGIAAVFATGAYAAFACRTGLGLPIPVCLPAGVLVATALGMVTEAAVHRPLRRRGASALIQLVASIGVYVILQNLISLVFGDDTKIIRWRTVSEGVAFGGARITPGQLLIVSVSVTAALAAARLLRSTGVGKAIRAVASDPEAAAACGIGPDRALLWTSAIGSALAALAGILVALDVDLTPMMGMRALLTGMVATVVGGVGSVPGAVLGALFLALAQHLSAWQIGPQWQDAVAFAVLLFFLLLRPQGIFGRKLRRADI
jgi:branched-chain amino acid transport system permease protein